VAGRTGAVRAIESSMPPHACLRQGRRRPTPSFFAAGEVIDFALVTVHGLNNGSVCPLQGCRKPAPRFVPQALASASNMRRRWCARREAIGQRLELSEGMSLRGIKPPRLTSAELFFFCCDSAEALPALAYCSNYVAQKVFHDRTCPHPARFARRPQLERLEC